MFGRLKICLLSKLFRSNAAKMTKMKGKKDIFGSYKKVPIAWLGDMTVRGQNSCNIWSRSTRTVCKSFRMLVALYWLVVLMS